MKATQLLRRTFSPVHISDVAVQDNGQGIFLRAEPEPGDGGFRRSYWRGERGPSCVLQATYITAKAAVFTASEQVWKLWLLLFVGEIHAVFLWHIYILDLANLIYCCHLPCPVPYFVLRLQSFLKIFVSGFVNFMLHCIKGKMMLVILLILMTGLISWFGWF